jgi:serine/threonine protein kinase
VEVALKSLKLMNTLNQFLQEADIMRSLQHPNIVRFFGLYEDPVRSSFFLSLSFSQLLVSTKDGTLYMVTEYMANGALNHFLQEETIVVDNQQLIQMTFDIASGMK